MNGVRDEFHTALSNFELAVRGGDPEDMQRADIELRARFGAATPEEYALAGPALAGFLNDVPAVARGHVAVIIGACVESGADPVPCAPRILANLAQSLEGARKFAQRWPEVMDGTDMPHPEQDPLIPELFELFGESDVVAWWSLPSWRMAALAMLQRPAVRKRLGPIREMLRQRHDAFAEQSGDHWSKEFDYLLKVFEDEPLLVLHRDSGTGYRFRMSGLGDNFQLHTLLADALIGGGHVAGEAPAADAVAACRDAEGMVLTKGSFNLVAPDGDWIWNEGTPWDIPVVDGVRLLVLDPEPYQRNWPAGRYFPYLPGDLTFEQVLPEAEAAAWFSHVKPAKHPSD
ncbi:hypothetical protein [Nocardia sp. NPDC051832]|uniref:hypothetical protein n=1 Tax=Nocardia sp. NPDC051832 TaxID=3155673 RepID=UPI003437E2D1